MRRCELTGLGGRDGLAAPIATQTKAEGLDEAQVGLNQVKNCWEVARASPRQFCGLLFLLMVISSQQEGEEEGGGAHGVICGPAHEGPRRAPE